MEKANQIGPTSYIIIISWYAHDVAKGFVENILDCLALKDSMLTVQAGTDGSQETSTDETFY